MTGLDTNVLVRFFVKDDPVQAEVAARFIKTECTSESPGYINLIVPCELAWVLQRCYRIERSGIARLLQEILQTRELRVQSPGTVWRALDEYASGGAGFADCLTACLNEDEGCAETTTFDVAAARMRGMRLMG